MVNTVGHLHHRFIHVQHLPPQFNVQHGHPMYSVEHAEDIIGTNLDLVIPNLLLNVQKLTLIMRKLEQKHGDILAWTFS